MSERLLCLSCRYLPVGVGTYELSASRDDESKGERGTERGTERQREKAIQMLGPPPVPFSAGGGGGGKKYFR